jgi:hypothetical protein
MLILALLKIAKIWNQPVSIVEWMDKKMSYMYEYIWILFGHKKNGILSDVATQIDLENVMISEINAA